MRVGTLTHLFCRQCTGTVITSNNHSSNFKMLLLCDKKATQKEDINLYVIVHTIWTTDCGNTNDEKIDERGSRLV